ncbi:MAG: RagB/SusD family nutrient uptake outer membrane protein [Saprospiraceae bacterium]|nr:RagB/SusD family nutrient uptake outer membrane protein [Saprospiraceae bacterium]MBP6569563.1 RagB/SusD family nutrient uptake outer membrane protein [Saprospiraceae bacterium]
MKNIFKYLLILPLFGIISCSEDFTTIPVQDGPTVANYYKSEADVKAATAVLYANPWFSFNDKFFWTAGEELAGNLYHTWDQEGQFFYYSYNAGNAHINSGWRGLYAVVNQSNSVINDVPVFAKGNVSDAVITRAVAEARFVRAMAYYMLSEFFGEVPIIENPLEIILSGNTKLPKNTRNSVYEFIRRDLEFAAANLPNSDQPGRATSWTAKGLLSKVYLTMAQFNLLTNATASSDLFMKAKSLSQDVIENSGLRLMTNYADLFKIEHNNNSESMFAMQWMQGNYSQGNSRQANWARSSIITGNTEAWGGGKCMTMDFLEAVDPADKRKSAIYMDVNDVYPEINKANGGYKYFIVNRDATGKELESASPTLTALKKYVVGSAEDNAGKVSTNQATAINQYLLRLADVYLIYVEAAIGAGSSTSDARALQYFNAIRSRAGLLDASVISSADLLKERRMEFALESLYWFDIKRAFYRDPVAVTQMLSNQKRDYVFYRDQSSGAADEKTKEGYIMNINGTGKITFRPENINLPIPESEVVDNDLLAPGAPAVEYKF